MDANAYWALFFLIGLATFIALPANNDYIGDDVESFKFGIENDLPERFVYPMLYWIANPLYDVIGEAVYIILPLLFFAGALWFIVKLFKEFKLDYRIIGIALAMNFLSVNFLITFTRDSLMFMLSSIWTYFYLRTYYNGFKDFIALIILTPMIFFTRADAGFLFIFLLLLMVVIKVVKLIKEIILLIKYVYPEVGIYGSAIATIPGNFEYKVNQIIQFGFEALFKFDATSFLFAFSNPVYIFTSFMILVTRNWLHMTIILLTLFSSYIIGNVAFIFGELSFRYLFSLMPLHLFFLGLAYQKNPKVLFWLLPLLLMAFIMFGLKMINFSL